MNPVLYFLLSYYIQKSPTDEEEGAHCKKRSGATTEGTNAKGSGPSRFSRRLHPKITTLEIPGKENVIRMFKKDEQEGWSGNISSDGYETAEVLSDDDFTVSKRNLFDEDEETYVEEPGLDEEIIRRINSHKRSNSYQWAQRLSCKWTTYRSWATN